MLSKSYERNHQSLKKQRQPAVVQSELLLCKATNPKKVAAEPNGKNKAQQQRAGSRRRARARQPRTSRAARHRLLALPAGRATGGSSGHCEPRAPRPGRYGPPTARGWAGLGRAGPVRPSVHPPLWAHAGRPAPLPPRQPCGRGRTCADAGLLIPGGARSAPAARRPQERLFLSIPLGPRVLLTLLFLLRPRLPAQPHGPAGGGSPRGRPRPKRRLRQEQQLLVGLLGTRLHRRQRPGAERGARRRRRANADSGAPTAAHGALGAGATAAGPSRLRACAGGPPCAATCLKGAAFRAPRCRPGRPRSAAPTLHRPDARTPWRAACVQRDCSLLLRAARHPPSKYSRCWDSTKHLRKALSF